MPQSQRNVYTLFFTLAVVMLGFGLIIPIMPTYIRTFGATGETMGLLMATFSTTQFLFSPLWGSLSDRYGRKRILLIGVSGFVVAQAAMGVATHLWMLFVARIVSGALSSATMPTAMAYLSDNTTPAERGGRMGMMGAAMSVGMILGPAVGGWLSQRSISLPFLVAAALSAVSFVLILRILPESRPSSAASGAGRALRGPNFSAMRLALTGPLGFLMILALLYSFGLTNWEGIWGMYALYRFGWGPSEVGTIMMVLGLTSALVQGVLTGPFTRRWGDVKVIRGTLIATAAGFVLISQANSFPTVLAAAAFFVCSTAMLNPSVTSLVSKRAAGGQGAAMGMANSFMSLGRIIGPIWAGYALDIYLQLPFYTGAAVFVVAFAASLIWLKSARAPAPAPAAEPAGS